MTHLKRVGIKDANKTVVISVTCNRHYASSEAHYRSGSPWRRLLAACKAALRAHEPPRTSRFAHFRVRAARRFIGRYVARDSYRESQ